ncbi:nucleocapsid protein [Achimota virus 1]|uniref:Nucleocapsid n=1 Tax=Achimota virus 1 TaxID=1261100 RepID=K7X4M4_9MONO|nr:nucleocapsid protein [Achimota virus 1]AFX75103.1 nucleocapsid protein [Achimota virus 1]
MSSVFKAFEQFTLEQDQYVGGNNLELPPETLQTTIKVFILNTQNPQTRYQMLCFCLRIIASNSARTAQKYGAMLTVLSLPTAMMHNHMRIADRSPDSIIERIEIEGFEPGSYRLRPNARTPMTQGEIIAMENMADDLPDTIVNQTPFVNTATEDEICDEMEKFLNAVYSVLIQVWVMVCKCMTAFDQPTGSDARRLAKYQQQGRMDQKYVLQGEVRRLIQLCIRESLTIRQFLVNEMQTARRQGPITGKYYAMVGDVARYIENAGMGAFFMTVKFALGNRWPPLALAAFSGELVKIKGLMMLYRKLGDRAKYMALLEMSEMMDFAPANYQLLYSYAMGIGSVQDPQMRGYNFARPFLNPAFFQLGMETANRQQGSVDREMAEELGLTDTERREMAAQVTRLTTGRGAGDQQDIVNIFGARARNGRHGAQERQFRVIEGDDVDDEEGEDDDQDNDDEEAQRQQYIANEQARWQARLAEIEERQAAERGRNRQGRQQDQARDIQRATAQVHQEPAAQDLIADLIE